MRVFLFTNFVLLLAIFCWFDFSQSETIPSDWIVMNNYMDSDCSEELLNINFKRPDTCTQDDGDQTSWRAECTSEAYWEMMKYSDPNCKNFEHDETFPTPTGMCYPDSIGTSTSLYCPATLPQEINLEKQVPIVIGVYDSVEDCEVEKPNMIQYLVANLCRPSGPDGSQDWKILKDGYIEVHLFANTECSGQPFAVLPFSKGECSAEYNAKLLSTKGENLIADPNDNCPVKIEEEVVWNYKSQKFQVNTLMNYKIESSEKRTVVWNVEIGEDKYEVKLKSKEDLASEMKSFYNSERQSRAVLKIELLFGGPGLPTLKLSGGYWAPGLPGELNFVAEWNELPKDCADKKPEVSVSHFEISASN